MGLSVSFGCLLRFFSVGVFVRLSGASSPPRKSVSRPSLRGVCVRSDRMPCHHLFGFSAGGSPAVTTGDPTKRVVTCADI